MRFALLLLLSSSAAAYVHLNILAYGAVGDNYTDCTAAFRAALAAAGAAGGGQVLVPAPGVFQTAPFNLSSNVDLRVEGTVFGVADATRFPFVAPLPSYASTSPGPRRHPLVWAVGAQNVSVSGAGVIDGGGPYWWPAFFNASGASRPHLLEANACAGVEVSGVTLRNSAFWTLRPVYSTHVHIHDMRIEAPWCENYACANDDGIDVDSCSHVLIERNVIHCGDDHVTVISGAGESGRAWAMPSRNVTVIDNALGTGMGLSIGSSVSGGVEGVLFARNSMAEGRGEWGIGAHLKTRVGYGGFVRNVTWRDSVFEAVTSTGLEIETDYQSSGQCNASTCTSISGISYVNLTLVGPGTPGSFNCFPGAPCENVTWRDVRVVNTSGAWDCKNVASGSVENVVPGGLAQACGLSLR
jgi:polygalacturonase